MAQRQLRIMKHTAFSLILAAACLTRSALAADAPSPPAFLSQANGQIELSLQRHSPVFAEFERSPALSARLTESLASKGFAIAVDKSSAKAVLVFSGDLVVVGGPVFHKGIKLPVGEITEKALREAKEQQEVTRAEVVQATAGIAINSVALRSSITPFWRGLALSGIASSLGSATGVAGAFNKAVSGDPRGFCLSRCVDWNKVTQTVYLRISMQAGDTKQQVRVLTETASEALVPAEVLDRALSDGIAAIMIVDASDGASK